MKTRLLVASLLLVGACVMRLGVNVEAGTGADVEPDLQVRLGTGSPRRLSDTGLYAPDGTIDPRNRPFSPQYPLWSDGAAKSRWIRLPEGSSIDVSDVDRWDFPAGTRFWKEFRFGDRKVETRFLRRETDGSWTFASYAWNEAQTDAVLAPEEGMFDVAEIAPGKRHSIPAVTDCRACHDSDGGPVPRTNILGFSALQLSTDRDPGAPHAEPLMPEMITLRTLVEEGRLTPAQSDLLATPPRIDAPDARTRSVLGYLSTNCGSCHNGDSSLANLGLFLKANVSGSHSASGPSHPAPSHRAPRTLAPSHPLPSHLLGKTEKWQIPDVAEGESRFVTPGAPDLSAILVRMKSRRPSSQMPPLGTVLHDRDAIDLVTTWVEEAGAALVAPGQSRW